LKISYVAFFTNHTSIGESKVVSNLQGTAILRSSGFFQNHSPFSLYDVFVLFDTNDFVKNALLSIYQEVYRKEITSFVENYL
jgi:hypothetical protein